MLFYLFALLVGYYRVTTTSPVKVANLMKNGVISVFGFGAKEGKAHFYVLLWQKNRLTKTLSAYQLAPDSMTLCGLPAFFVRYRYRVGAFLGVGVAVFLTVLSGQFVFKIEVVGNDKVADEEVLSLLAHEGVFEGAYIKDIDPLAVANRCVMKSDLVSWMSVNIVGNCIEAVVVEYADREVAEKDDTPSNVVATKSGIVTRVELSSGVSAVKEGSVVREGQLLISGVNLLRNETYIYQKAKGRVFAETLNEITVEEAVNTVERVYTGEVFTENSLIFFTKEKKFTKDSGNLPASCDRIEKKERVMLFGVIPLPIWRVRVEYHAFTLEDKTLSEEEALRLAFEKAYRQVAEGELVSIEESYSFDGEKATVTLRYRMVEDIAADLPLFETP